MGRLPRLLDARACLVAGVQKNKVIVRRQLHLRAMDEFVHLIAHGQDVHGFAYFYGALQRRAVIGACATR